LTQGRCNADGGSQRHRRVGGRLRLPVISTLPLFEIFEELGCFREFATLGAGVTLAALAFATALASTWIREMDRRMIRVVVVEIVGRVTTFTLAAFIASGS
jgi:hypothetical protein